jgi:HK97 gp10 family phage protein|tara:strand:- start:899 stop:1258 length:360 start_codon:yes stop_codon:yes gene_type:complete
MARTIQVKITHNIPQVITKLATFPPRISRGLSRAIRKSGLLVERASKIRSPVDTGRMRASINTTFKPMIATIMPNVDYAIFVHEGTSRMRGRPFLSQGLEDVDSEINRIFEKEIKAAIK